MCSLRRKMTQEETQMVLILMTTDHIDKILKTKWLDCRDTALQLIGYIAVTRHFRNLDR